MVQPHRWDNEQCDRQDEMVKTRRCHLRTDVRRVPCYPSCCWIASGRMYDLSRVIWTAQSESATGLFSPKGISETSSSEDIGMFVYSIYILRSFPVATCIIRV